MLEVGFRDLKDNLTDMRNKQAVRRTYFMSASIPVRNGGRGKATLVCDQDADIQILGLNGSIVAPADVYGRRLTTQPTIWPLVEQAGFAIEGYAERGIIMRVYDSSAKELQLSDPLNFMDAKMFLQPGYRIGAMFRPMPFRHYMQRDSKLTFEFINTDTAPDYAEERPPYHFVTLVLTCRKYEPFTK